MKASHVAAMLAASVALYSGAASSAERRVGIGTVNAITQFHDVSHHRISYSHPWSSEPGTSAWYPEMIRVSMGLLWRNGEHARLYSAGPVWRWKATKLNCNCYLEAGLGAGFLSNPIFHNPRNGEYQNFGNRLQFVTNGGLVWVLGDSQEWELAFGLQHISNGGIGQVNPGADFVGIDIYRRF